LKEKYNFPVEEISGLFGVEVRNLPTEFMREFNINNTSKADNIFIVGNELIITGSFKEILNSLRQKYFNELLNSEIESAINHYNLNESIKYNIGSRLFDFNFAYVMGILNVTPDSFSDGGQFLDREKAVSYALHMNEADADIIDIGGESTRPGSEPVSETEVLERVIPVIKGILNAKSDTIISIDTTKAKVVREALGHGALIVNDISGGTFEPEIFNVVAENNAVMILMHIKGRPKSMQESPEYTDVISEVYDYLYQQSTLAKTQGITKIIVDPGIGFGKNIEHNLTILDRLDDFKSLGLPVMIGLSRKSFIGKILNLPGEERDDATNSLNSIALCKGARIIRTHNVEKAVQTCRLFNQMIRN
jgi:dihydropteroate synthase